MPTMLAGREQSTLSVLKPNRRQWRSTIEAVAQPESRLSKICRTALRLAWKLVVLAAIVFLVLDVRVFVFEYTHGGKEVVHKLFEFLIP